MRRVTNAHEAILRALENANREHGRACTAAEIIVAMPSEDERLIRDSYAKVLNIAVASVLVLLQGKKLVVSPGRSGKHRYYAVTSVFNSLEITLPDITSRRQRVLAFVREAVAHYGRAVRAVDVSAYIEDRNGTDGLTPLLVTRDMRNLAASGELRIIVIRGDGRGFNTYFPAEISTEQYASVEPLTWLEEVRDAFEWLWQERLQQANAEGSRPKPISTSEVRIRLASAFTPHPHLDNPKLLPNAMLQLAASVRPAIRRVDRGELQAAMWAPIYILDECLDVSNSYASDAERVSCALRRACERHDLPVTAEAVAQEIEQDNVLRPDSTESIAVLLSDVAKKVIVNAKGVRRERGQQFARRVGQSSGKTYYWHGGVGVEAARLHVSLLQVDDWWRELRVEQHILDVDECRLSSVAVGRVLQLEAEAAAVCRTLKFLIDRVNLDKETGTTAARLHTAISQDIEKVRLWLTLHKAKRLSLPDEVSTGVSGWTAEELLPVIQPLYPASQQIKEAHELVTLLDGDIHRVPNPAFLSRFDTNSRSAAEYLFDRADALMFIARHWGGDEAVFQANMATPTLGLLRDAQFVLPELASANFEDRLVAVACLAFLSGTAPVYAALNRVAEFDPDPSVRAGAAWAHRLVTSEHNQLAKRLTE